MFLSVSTALALSPAFPAKQSPRVAVGQSSDSIDSVALAVASVKNLFRTAFDTIDREN